MSAASLEHTEEYSIRFALVLSEWPVVHSPEELDQHEFREDHKWNSILYSVSRYRPSCAHYAREGMGDRAHAILRCNQQMTLYVSLNVDCSIAN